MKHRSLSVRFLLCLVLVPGMIAVVPTIMIADSRAADVFAGRTVYEQHCQTCHGERGRPVDPGTPDFSQGDSLFESDSALVRKIRSGSGAMPAYRGLLTDDEIRDVVAYLRTLQ